jgi:hypothetical protein
MTLASRLHSLQEQALPAARAALADAARQAERARAAVEKWPRLESLVADLEAARREAEQVDADLALLDPTVAGQVERLEEWLDAERQRQEELAGLGSRDAELSAEADKLDAEQKQLDAEQKQLAPLVEAKAGQRWWTGAFWRAKLGGSPQPRLEEIAARCQAISERLEAIGSEQARIEAQRREILDRREGQRQALVTAHREQRRGELEAQQAALAARYERLLTAWREAGGPAESSRASLETARATAAAELEQAEAKVARARAWLRALETSLPGLPAQLLAEASVLAATIPSLPREPFPGRSLPEFDLVLIEEAHRISDADLVALARRGRRVVLIGEAAAELPVAPPPKRADRPRAAMPQPPFTRLWSALHPDPRRLNARCRHAHGRLVVTLRRVTPEQEAWLQQEPLYDRPDVELGIVSEPGQEPWVAEVVFPGSFTVAEAKQFLHAELQELALNANAPAPRWGESPGAVALELSGEAEPDAAVPLEGGVRERGRYVHHDGEVTWQTCALEFDRAAGWDRAGAERWVEEKLGLRDSGRTAVLARDYRARPALARFVSRVLYNGAVTPGRDAGGLTGGPAVRFVAVPDSRPDGRRGEAEPRRNGGGTATLAPRMRTARGGAGLEVDLVDPRRPDALPLELRPHLPGRGVVNYLEAAAVVKALEELAADPQFRAAAAEWQARPAGCPAACRDEARPPRAPVVVALSAFPAQAELIRLLVRRSPALAGFPVEVGLPGDMAQRECLVALVSLTRSHATRAVPFSDHPRDLLLALTRPAERLVVFGDPGTMSRRSQWFGALDHLDETTGPLEQALLAQLLAHMPEQEATARAGRTLESSSV